MILGEVGTSLSDQQIQEVIDYMFALAQIEYDYMQTLQRSPDRRPGSQKKSMNAPLSPDESLGSDQ